MASNASINRTRTRYTTLCSQRINKRQYCGNNIAVLTPSSEVKWLLWRCRSLEMDRQTNRWQSTIRVNSNLFLYMRPAKVACDQTISEMNNVDWSTTLVELLLFNITTNLQVRGNHLDLIGLEPASGLHRCSIDSVHIWRRLVSIRDPDDCRHCSCLDNITCDRTRLGSCSRVPSQQSSPEMDSQCCACAHCLCLTSLSRWLAWRLSALLIKRKWSQDSPSLPSPPPTPPQSVWRGTGRRRDESKKLVFVLTRFWTRATTALSTSVKFVFFCSLHMVSITATPGHSGVAIILPHPHIDRQTVSSRPTDRPTGWGGADAVKIQQLEQTFVLLCVFIYHM